MKTSKQIRDDKTGNKPAITSFVVNEQRLSTNDVAPSDRESYWRDEALKKIGLVVDVAKLGDNPIACNLHVKALSNKLVVGRTNYGSQRLIRTTKHTRMSEGGFFVLGMKHVGGIEFTQNKQTIKQNEDCCIFYYADKPFEIKLNNCQDILLQLPEHVLLEQFAYARDLPAFSFAGDSAYYGILRQFIETLYLLPKSTTQLQGLQLREALVQTLMAAIFDSGGHKMPKCSCLDAHHYYKSIYIMKSNFHNADLNVQTIAKAAGLSSSHLQKVFASHQTTVMQKLWDIRLQKAADYLLAPTQVYTYISEVAYQCGFKSPAHFTRAFRRRYGTTPTDWIAHHADV